MDELRKVERLMLMLPVSNHRGPPFEELLKQRRSVRSFLATPLTVEQLGLLCFAAQGITGELAGHPLRTAPSAGAIHPLAVYLIAQRVTDVEMGGYGYRPVEHALEPVVLGDLQQRLNDAGFGQQYLVEAAATFVITATPEPMARRYLDRAARFVAVEVGHATQNLLLAATSLGLGAVGIGVFDEEEIERLFELDHRVSQALYLIAVGVPRR